MFDIRPTPLAGCVEIGLKRLADERGSFLKTFHRPAFVEAGLHADYAEEYVNVSVTGVLRGLHLQTPPFAHTKIVTCLAGKILDVVVDLRPASPTYLQHHVTVLSPESSNQLYIEPGLAHGFYVLEGDAVLHYRTSTVHAPSHDTGVLWSACGVEWPDASPILSERDKGWASAADFPRLDWS